MVGFYRVGYENGIEAVFVPIPNMFDFDSNLAKKVGEEPVQTYTKSAKENRLTMPIRMKKKTGY